MAESGRLPVGSIVAMLASFGHPPDGWLPCNGSTFSAEDYPELAKILPNNTLPNLAGLTLIGAGKTEAGEYGAQQTYGAATHKMTIEEMPSHKHFGFGERDGFTLGHTNAVGYEGSNGGIDWDNRLYGTTYTGGRLDSKASIPTSDGSMASSTPQPNDAFSLMQPSFAVNFFICAE